MELKKYLIIKIFRMFNIKDYLYVIFVKEVKQTQVQNLKNVMFVKETAI